MSMKEIKEMINLMNEHDLAELELERDGLKVKLRKNSGSTPPIIASSTGESVTQGEITKERPVAAEIQGLIEIKSPMVGTFYRAPSPENAPFADIGSDIQPGQVVCIIEAMKLMNEIKAEVKGKVREILVENGHPVEFGQVLFRVEPL